MPTISAAPHYLNPSPRREYVQLPQQQPGLMDIIGASLGEGLGQGIYEQLEQSALQKALGNLKPGGSALDMIQALSQAPASQREFLGKYAFPLLQEEQKQKIKQQQQSTLANILSGTGGLNEIPSAVGNMKEEEASSTLKNEVALMSDSQLAKTLPFLNTQEQKLVLDERYRQQKLSQQQKSENRKSEEALSIPYLQKLQNQEDTLVNKRNAIQLIRNSSEKGDVNTIKQWVVDVTGFEPLRSASAATFKTAGKEYFLSNVARAGTRPNQWIEQQIADMMPKIGRSKEANLNLSDILESEINIDEEKIRLAQELSKKYKDEIGYIPSEISSIVNQALKPYAQQQLDILAYKFRKNYELDHPKEMDRISKVPQGTPLTLEKFDVFLKKNKNDVEKAFEMAKKSGYTIMDNTFYEEVQ